MNHNLSNQILLEKIQKFKLFESFFQQPIQQNPQYHIEYFDQLKVFIEEIFPIGQQFYQKLKENYLIIQKNQDSMEPFQKQGSKYLRDSTQTTLEQNFMKQYTQITSGKECIYDNSLVEQLNVVNFRQLVRTKVIQASNLINESFGKHITFKHKHAVEFIQITDKILNIYGYLRADNQVLANRCYIDDFNLSQLMHEVDLDKLSGSIMLDPKIFQQLTTVKMIPNLSNYEQLKSMVETQIQIMHQICIDDHEDNLKSYQQDIILNSCLQRMHKPFINQFRKIVKQKEKEVDNSKFQKSEQTFNQIKDKIKDLGKKLLPFLQRIKFDQVDIDYYRNLPISQKNNNQIVNLIDDSIQIFSFIKQIQDIKQEQNKILDRMKQEFSDQNSHFFKEIFEQFQVGQSISIMDDIYKYFENLQEVMENEMAYIEEKKNEHNKQQIQENLDSYKKNPYLQNLATSVNPDFKIKDLDEDISNENHKNDHYKDETIKMQLNNPNLYQNSIYLSHFQHYNQNLHTYLPEKHGYPQQNVFQHPQMLHPLDQQPNFNIKQHAYHERTGKIIDSGLAQHNNFLKNQIQSQYNPYTQKYKY